MLRVRKVHINTGRAGAFTLSRLTRDGVMITPEAYWIEVKTDDNGGEAGPPTEIQYIGETSRIRCEMTKYDPNNALLLQTRLNGLNLGQSRRRRPTATPIPRSGAVGQVVQPAR